MRDDWCVLATLRIFCVKLDISNLFIYLSDLLNIIKSCCVYSFFANCERIWYAEEIKEWFPVFANDFNLIWWDTSRHCFAMLFSGSSSKCCQWGYSNKLWVLKMFAQLRFERQYWNICNTRWLEPEWSWESMFRNSKTMLWAIPRSNLV